MGTGGHGGGGLYESQVPLQTWNIGVRINVQVAQKSRHQQLHLIPKIHISNAGNKGDRVPSQAAWDIRRFEVTVDKWSNFPRVRSDNSGFHSRFPIRSVPEWSKWRRHQWRLVSKKLYACIGVWNVAVIRREQSLTWSTNFPPSCKPQFSQHVHKGRPLNPTQRHTLMLFTKSHSLFYTLRAKLNPICHLLALLGAHHILHVSRTRIKGFDVVQVRSLLSWDTTQCWFIHSHRNFGKNFRFLLQDSRVFNPWKCVREIVPKRP
jgi:hypothetical protein